MLLLVLAYVACAHGQRSRYNFDRDWLVNVGDSPTFSQTNLDDSNWKRVTLPHAWNEDSAYKVAISNLPTGVAWYRKHFRVPNVPKQGRVFVEFQGARLAAEVFLNGHSLGLSENGVMAFGFDLTPYLVPGDNVIAARTDNSWDYREAATGSKVQWNNNNFYANYGGLNKAVWLYVTPGVHQTLPLYSMLRTTGQYIWADQFNVPQHDARIHIESQARNDTDVQATVRLRAVIRDLAGKPVATSESALLTLAPGETQTLRCETEARGLHFWSWGYGYLYSVTTTLVVNGKPIDSAVTRTGFRQTAFHNGMVYLNGRVIEVHGYAARSTNEWPALGTDVPPWVSDFSNGLMVRDNANLVRWMHVTPSKQDIQSCDRMGLMVSMPAGDAEGDPNGREWQARVELMRDAIIYNRNDPSIIFYESGNHGISEEHMRDMLEVRNEFDPHGGRAIGAREMLASHKAEYGGEMLYIDKSATKPLWAHEYNRDEGARKFWNEQTPPYHKDSPLYNRDQDSFTLEDVYRWDDYFRARPGTGNRVSAGGVNISWIDENSHFRGDNNYRRSGEVDAMRIPKDAFFAHQVMWDGWVDPEHPRVHINGHWNYSAGTIRTVYVEANTYKVELKLNGRSLGVKHATNDFLFTWRDVHYESGQMEAIAYDTHGAAVAKTTLETSGAPYAIRLTPHVGPGGLHADGSDLALIDVEVVDTKGRRVPTALDMIDFTLSGPAEWRGGIAQGTAHPEPLNTIASMDGQAKEPPAPYLHYDNYILSRQLPVEGGVNRVSIRSTTKAGRMTLIARSKGLREATVSFESSPTTERDGLSSYDPAANLPVNLSRGPTPQNPSYRVTRVSIPIMSATAGANSEHSALSYDDNETTSWTNASAKPKDIDADGLPIRHALPDHTAISASLTTAWIEYTLTEPASPFEMDLKLGSFRVRRYPLRITLDGETVYSGTTPTSLGYVTLPLRQTRPGTKLRIELTAPAFDIDEKHQLVELNGRVNQAEPTWSQGVPVLAIIEAEIYQKPNGDELSNSVQ